MYSTVITFFMCIIMVIGYPSSRFLIEIEEPMIGAQLTKDVIIKEDIQTHYENLLDEVISTHDEDFLLKLTYMMTSEKIESFYRPQANMLLENRYSTIIHDSCLYHMPHWIGKYLHDTHSSVYNNVAHIVQAYMEDHWPSSQHQQEMTRSDIKEFVVQLNQHLMARIDHTMMDPVSLLTDLSLKLQLCQQKYAKGSFLSSLMIRLSRGCRDLKTRHFLTNGLTNGNLKTHFLVNYLMAMREDMTTQMDDRITDLVQLIHDDMNDEYAD